jgi:peptidyl-dipeptidase Dcp
MTKCKNRSRSFALLSDFSNDIRLNPTFARVKAVYDSRESLKLSPEQVTLLDKNTKVFLEMAPTYRKRRKQITRNRQRTIKAESAFENIFAETNAFEMHLTDEKTLPDYPKELSKPLVLKQKRKEKKVGFSP